MNRDKVAVHIMDLPNDLYAELRYQRAPDRGSYAQICTDLIDHVEKVDEAFFSDRNTLTIDFASDVVDTETAQVVLEAIVDRLNVSVLGDIEIVTDTSNPS